MKASAFDLLGQLTQTCDAAASDPFLANLVIGTAIQLLRDGKPLPYPVAQYLATALAKLKEHPGNAAHAFGLVAPKNRPPKSVSLRDYEIAMAVAHLCQQGTSQAKAVNEVVDMFDGATPETVLRIWKKLRGNEWLAITALQPRERNQDQ